MHTIIKIAVASVLSLFAIVGVVSISKAEETVWFCEMSEYFHITNYETKKKLDLEKFKMQVIGDQIKFSKGGYFDNKLMYKHLDPELQIKQAVDEILDSPKRDYGLDPVKFLSRPEQGNLAFFDGILYFSHVSFQGITSISAKCDKF